MSQSVHNVAAGGGSTPRAAKPNTHKGVAALLLAAALFSPLAMLTAAGTYVLLVSQVRYSWRFMATTATVVLLVVWLVLWPVAGGGLSFHFGWYPAAGSGAWVDAVRRALPLSIPFGALAGSLALAVVEWGTAGAEWHPIEQHRRAVVEAEMDRRVRDLLADELVEELGERIPIGVVREGDAVDWRDGRFPELAALPKDHKGSMVVAGSSGSGKTETLLRLVRVWAKAGVQVVFGDWKGTDPTLAARVMAIYREVVPDAVFAVWPAQAFDMWRGDGAAIVEKLLQVHDYTEPYYEQAAAMLVWFAVNSPEGLPRSSDEFMERLDAEYLERVWRQDAQALLDIAAVTGDKAAFNGVRMRFAGFFRSMAGRLDAGFSFEDADCVFLRVPWSSPRDAQAIARMMMVDFAAYAATRKERDVETVFIVDEFSAVTGAAPFAIANAERLRDVHARLVLTAQGWGGLGADDNERGRLVESMAGGFIVHQLTDPEKLAQLAGTVRSTGTTTQVGEGGVTGVGSVAVGFRMRVQPDKVREAPVGRAWIIHGGRALSVAVIVVRPGRDDVEFGERLVGYATQAEREMAEGRAIEPAEWWDRRLPGPYRPVLPSGPDRLELPGPGGPGPVLPFPAARPLHEMAEAHVMLAPRGRVLRAVESLVRAGELDAARRVAAAAEVPGWNGAAFVADVVEKRRQMRAELNGQHTALARRVRA